MSRYKNATMETLTFGEDAAESRKCDVRFLDDGGIEVNYINSTTITGYTTYEGNEKGGGHYFLESDEPSGRSTLHRFKGSPILEGFWEEEEGKKGMWRIQLSQVDDEVTGVDISSLESTSFDEMAFDEELENLICREESVEEEEEEEEWGDEPVPRIYNFALRYDWDVRLSLPADLTRREGSRLASFVKALSCDS